MRAGVRLGARARTRAAARAWGSRGGRTFGGVLARGSGWSDRFWPKGPAPPRGARIHFRGRALPHPPRPSTATVDVRRPVPRDATGGPRAPVRRSLDLEAPSEPARSRAGGQPERRAGPAGRGLPLLERLSLFLRGVLTPFDCMSMLLIFSRPSADLAVLSCPPTLSLAQTVDGRRASALLTPRRRRQARHDWRTSTLHTDTLARAPLPTKRARPSSLPRDPRDPRDPLIRGRRRPVRRRPRWP